MRAPSICVPLLLVAVTGCARSGMDLDGVPGPANFRMTNNLVGVVKKAAPREDVGETITFVDLGTDEPKVVFGRSGMTSPLSKVYEDENSITLLLVASGSGGVDAFVVDKQAGKFARGTAGSVGGVYATASVGVFVTIH